MSLITGRIFNIQRFSVQDGPGIRTTVFLKGCPLICPWCSNPESQRSDAELGHRDALCDGCGRCVEACERRAITLEGEAIRVDRDLCTNCGECVPACTAGALKMLGEERTVEDVVQEVRKDDLYYRNSGGGVTVSGGEPLAQSHFVAALLRKCRGVGIHTTLDTCGFGPLASLERVLEHTDLVLFDLKLIDTEAHLGIVSNTNRSILRNARRVLEMDIPMIVRVPLIPGLTETEENIEAIKEFVAAMDEGVRAVNVLPYHRFGLSKYGMLDRKYELGDLAPPPKERVQAVVESFEALDVPCEVVT